MLKLLKYEWKACARTCLPLYGVLILMSLISRILYVIPKNASLDFMLPAIGSMLYMGVMMAAFVVTAVILIQRFYKNLLGSEGYLMFTLPVTVSQHLLSKTSNARSYPYVSKYSAKDKRIIIYGILKREKCAYDI